jgi:hypothetical protein
MHCRRLTISHPGQGLGVRLTSVARQIIYVTNLMFCWPCIVIYQYSRTNKMHFLFSVYCKLTASTWFKHLFAHHQEALHVQWLVYFVCIMSADCYHSWSGTAVPLQYTNCCVCSASWWWTNKCSKHVEAINRNKLKENSASCWSYYSDICYKTQWLIVNG